MMKLLLTSGGLTNQSIINALKELVGKSLDKSKLAFIPTAANPEWGDKSWLVDDLVNCKNLNLEELDVVDISALEKDDWLKRLQSSDIILVGGGLTWYLMDWVRKSGLQSELSDLLESHVYVGISAGSMITAPELYSEQMKIIYEDEDVPPDGNDEALGLIDFLIVPHFKSEHFPNVSEENTEKVSNVVGRKTYLLDDASAVRCMDGKVDVVSQGVWREFN